MITSLRVASTAAWLVPAYWIGIFPLARRELGGWRRLASTIPDPDLRATALAKLASEHMVAEGAAAFATLSDARHWRDVVRFCVAFETMYDYVDALAEQPTDDVLENNRLLYDCLVSAVSPNDIAFRAPASWSQNDGGYISTLISSCQQSFRRLPAAEHVVAQLQEVTRRAAWAQSVHHASQLGEREPLDHWIEVHRPLYPTLEWWELAAACGSPLSVYALVAAAARPETSESQAARIADAYVPWIGALSWLLEGLVDHEHDLEDGSASFVSHYREPRVMSERFAFIADAANRMTWQLPMPRRHCLLLTGMASMYLSDEGAATPYASPVASVVLDALDGPGSSLVRMLRFRRRLVTLLRNRALR
jgi:tetraprenyl-beta-curcumene synthase